MYLQNAEHTGVPIAEQTVVPARIEAENYARFSDIDAVNHHSATHISAARSRPSVA